MNDHNGERDDLVAWPPAHFAEYRRQFPTFDAEAVRAALALRSSAQRVENALGAWFADAGLTPQKFGVLVVLYAEPEALTLSELRRFLGTTQANVTGLIAGLERAGMISRRGGTDDRRVSFVRLSGAGRKLVRGLLPEYFALQRSALRTLSASEKKTLVALLAKVAHGFQGAVEA